MIVQTKGFSPAALERFKELQRRSFSILESAAATLGEGQTEKDVARSLVRKYREAGFTSFFHLPVVLFGERTALPGDWTIAHFFPKDRALNAGDSVIMDASPICEGFLVDTSYSFCMGENAVHRDMMANLAGFRAAICDAVNTGRSFKEIAEDVLLKFASYEYEPAHAKHPGAVLGHRAVKFARLPVQWRINGFDGLALTWFRLKDRFAQTPLCSRSPLWNDSQSSDHAPHDGLWLVEPHAGKDGVGAKWEEILVIDRGKARWLDDQPPHVRQWASIAKGGAYGPLG